jgi:anaerobic selenocysteine-containing dehydrogenase
MKKVVHAACPHDCPDACAVLITVDEGKAIKIQGDPEHPVTRGFLCAKVAKYLDRVYSPDRVLYPLRRVGPKGCTQGSKSFGNFERISWDAALAEIADRFRRISSEFGSESILPYSYGGTLGVLNGSSMDRRFFHRLGASQLDRTICSSAGEAGIESVLGVKLGTEPEQFRHSRFILAWGSNIHANNVHLWPFIEEARRQGGKFVVIDPYQTRTARCADWFLPINPGTDAALALGMMHVIIGESLYDADYVAKHTFGFGELAEKVQNYTPDRVAQWTGLSAGDVVKLAREYATIRPAVIRVNYGVQRSESGGTATRAITMLPCITGSWKEVGGGLQLSTSGSWDLRRADLRNADLMQTALGRPARTINMVELGTVLTQPLQPPIKALFVYNSNPAAVCPNHNAVVKGLLRPDLFTVVHEQFLTDTTDYADIVLPATTFFEHKDLQTSYGHYHLQLSQPAIAPLGQCRSNVETFRALAKEIGFDEPCFDQTVDEMIDVALATTNPWLAGIDRGRLEREASVRLNFASSPPGAGGSASDEPFLPFASGRFRTPHGKAALCSSELKAQGLDPVAEFVPPTESRHTPSAREFPLELLARKADNFLNSTFSNIPSVQAMEDPGYLQINAADASKRGIADEDLVRVFNGRGEIRLRARVNGVVQPGVVSATLQWAKLSPGGRNVNVLTSEKLADMGNSATFYSVLVEVELAKPDH